jgi:hypothetical protein
MKSSSPYITRQTGRHVPREAVQAGLTCPTGPNLPANFPKTVLPGLPKLFRINQSLTELPHLLLARGPSASRVVRVLLPPGAPAAEALLEHVRLRLGDRWAGEVPFEDHEKLLGLRPPWWYRPVGLLGGLFLGALILFAMMGFAALLTGRIEEIPGFVWAAMAGWAGVVGWILWIYRRRQRDH